MNLELAIEAKAMPQAAEEAAFGDIFSEHYALVFTISARTLGSREEAEEVVQETFVKLYARWPRLALHTNLRAWLARVALNLSFSRLRSQTRLQSLQDKLESLGNTAVGSTEEEFLAMERRAHVGLVLMKLKARDRACLVARYSGLSYREVAEAVGIRPASVGKVLQRAEARFKQAFLSLEGVVRA